MTQALACPTLVHPPDTDLTRCQIGMSPRHLLQHFGGFVMTHDQLDELGEMGWTASLRHPMCHDGGSLTIRRRPPA
ncbi:hypothetical protein [Acetobacter pasteurianus]|uniref:hypothetical protein n=1 Tax=Acetobacter pasteurianus TaxID=438 RepID=UPI000F5829E9|nr:hypothetical protein [Acetobacter pasteurianus]